MDQEWYWLREIARLLEGMLEPSGLEIAQLAVSIVSTLATVAIAALATYIAWKSHTLARETAEKQAAADKRTDRLLFLETYREYMRTGAEGWLKGNGRPFDADAYSVLTSRTMQLGGVDGAGALMLMGSLNEFEEKAEHWGTKDHLADFGTETGKLVLDANLWAMDPKKWLDRRVKKIREENTATDAATTD
ncbi:hypothetical protein BH09ACT5_BH09ACT5_05980 [soil metagenome]